MVQGKLFDIHAAPDDSFERSFINGGSRYVAGVDEAGRGPLAGAVVAAAVILPLPCAIDGINDSKKLTKKKREELYEIIFRKAISVGIGISEPRVIDEINILQATLAAMREAVGMLKPAPEAVLVDGISRIPLDIPQRTIKKGDSKCVSIAAASIIAKVARDRMMEALHRSYPDYGFDRHKGYGTEMHMEAIKTHLPCEAHRFTFAGVKELIGKKTHR